MKSVEIPFDITLKSHLDDKLKDFNVVFKTETMDELVHKDLLINMANANAKLRIANLLLAFHSLLRRHGLSWILENNQETTSYHFLSAVCPQNLRDRPQSDLKFSHHELRKNSKILWPMPKSFPKRCNFSIVTRQVGTDPKTRKITTNAVEITMGFPVRQTLRQTRLTILTETFLYVSTFLTRNAIFGIFEELSRLPR